MCVYIIVKKVSRLFLICDVCNTRDEPSFELNNKISDDTATQDDFPMHCNQTMRLTILEVPVEEKVIINLENIKWTLIETMKVYFLKTYGNLDLGEAFEKEYTLLIIDDGLTDFMTLINLKKSLRPALENIMKNDITEPLLVGTEIIDQTLQKLKVKSSALNESYSSFDICYYCTVCETEIEIPENEKDMLLKGDEDVDLPIHHDKVMDVMISRNENVSIEKTERSRSAIFSSSQPIENMELLSVGMDVGSSTSHLVFSKLFLERQQGFLNMTYRFNITNRKILYQGRIINTPLIDPTTIDIEKIVEFFQNEFKNAGYSPQDVDTGAVIVTGETAKKSNASEIVERLSDETGKFVCATAGPNFESLLAAMGSGATNRSKEKHNTILSVDIGGGTSNLAISSKGHVISTSCINVGGRLLGIDKELKIWRIDEPTKKLFDYLGLHYKLGDPITQDDLGHLSKTYADALIEVMEGSAKSKIAKELIMTENLDFSTPIDEIMFSGGVSEIMYSENKYYDDIGYLLAEYILKHDFGIPVVPPQNTIRATVIGAGSYSLAVSGSTCFYDKTIEFPLENIPILRIDALDTDSPENITEKINQAYQRFDLKEGEDIVGLYFPGMPIIHRDMYIPPFVKAIESALPRSVNNQTPIILLFQFDMAGMVGRTLLKETSIKTNYMSIDELDLAEGDFIDIGAPLKENHSFPIVVKSLVFN